MFSDIAASLRRSVRRSVRDAVARIVLLIAAALAGSVAAGFFVAAAYLVLEPVWGAPTAALIVAVAFLVVAVVLAWSATRVGAGTPAEPPIAERLRATLSGALAAGAIPALLRLRRRRDEAAADAAPLAEGDRVAAEGALRRLAPAGRICAGLLAGYLVGRIAGRGLAGPRASVRPAAPCGGEGATACRRRAPD